MKSMGFYLLTLALLAFLGACGKNNESGKSSYNYNNQYCAYPGSPGCYQNPNISPYVTNIGVVDRAQQENPCGGGSYYGAQRLRIQTQVQLQTTLMPNEIYLGVTSFGDVAFIQGTNGSNTAMMTALVCPRMGQGVGQVSQPLIGFSSRCPGIKLITAMNMYFPSGEVAKFRSPEAGIINPMTGQYVGKFSFCTY